MPLPSSAVIAWATSLLNAPVTACESLRDGGSPWLLRLGSGHHESVVLRTAAAGPAAHARQFATEAATLELAAAHGVAAPRLVAADLDATATGAFALLTTTAPGTSRIPALPTTARLRALGEAAAALHTVPLTPRPVLPLRTRPIESVDFAELRRAHGPEPLLDEAVRVLAGIPVPCADPVLVHGDLRQGNTMWQGDLLTALIDWDCAGAGHFGVDLGSLRCDAALHHGTATADVSSRADSCRRLPC